MGKRKSISKSSSLIPMKISKHEKKPQLNNLMKILRPKVYITDTSNFKTLVQQLTGNGKFPAADQAETSPPPTPTSEHLSPTTWEVPLVDTYQDFHHNLVYQENMMSSSVDVLSTSPELISLTAAAAFDRESEERQKMEIYKSLEAMLMEMDPDSCDYDACNYEMMFQDQDQDQYQYQYQDHHEVCVYDYDLSNFV